MSARNEDFLFAQEAEKLGYVSEQQVEEAFLLQRRMSDDLKIDERLAVILVKRGWLAEEQARRVYAIVDPKGASQQIEGYRLVAKIGRGAMGTVYKAIHERLNRPVAIKILRQDLATDKTQIERLKSEAQLLASLDHPNIVRAIDAGESNGFPYFVMEYVEGENLRDAIIRNGPFEEDEALRITRDLANALEKARRMGIVHRDVKPGNVLLTRRGQIPKLMDLGLAKGPIDLGLTQHGSTVGTPQFISPEQAQDPRKADTRSDIYSLGATLYAMLTSRPPFEGATLAEIITKVLYEQPTPIRVRNDNVSPEVSYLVQRMMVKDPSLRYKTPADVAEDIDRIRGGRSIVPAGFTGNWEAFLLRRRMRRWVRRGAIAAAALVVVGVATVFLFSHVKRKEALTRISASETRLLDAESAIAYDRPFQPLKPEFPTNIDQLRREVAARATAVHKAHDQAVERRAYITDQEEIAGTQGLRHDEVAGKVSELASLARDLDGFQGALVAALEHIRPDAQSRAKYAKARAALDGYNGARSRTAAEPVRPSYTAAVQEIVRQSNLEIEVARRTAASRTRRPGTLPDFASDWKHVLNDFHGGRFVPNPTHQQAVRELQALQDALSQIKEDLDAVTREFGPAHQTPEALAASVTGLVTRLAARRSVVVRDARARLKPLAITPLEDIEDRLIGPGRPVTAHFVRVRNQIDRAVETHNDDLIVRAEHAGQGDPIEPDLINALLQELRQWRREIESPYPERASLAETAQEDLQSRLDNYRDDAQEFFIETRGAAFAALQQGDPAAVRKVIQDAALRRDAAWADDPRLAQLAVAADELERLQARAMGALAQRLKAGRPLERVRLRDDQRKKRVKERWKLLAVNTEQGTVDVEARAQGTRPKAVTYSIHDVHPEQLMVWLSKSLSNKLRANKLRAVAKLSSMHLVQDEPGVDLRAPYLASWQATHEAFDALADPDLAIWSAFVRERYKSLAKTQAERENDAVGGYVNADKLRSASRWVEAHDAIDQLISRDGRLRYTDAYDKREDQIEEHRLVIDAALKRDELRVLMPGAKVEALGGRRVRFILDCDTPVSQKKNFVRGLGQFEREPVDANVTPQPSIAPKHLVLLKGARSFVRDRPLSIQQPFDPAFPWEFEFTMHTLAGSHLLAIDMDGPKVAVCSADPRIHDRRFGTDVPKLEDEKKAPEYNFYGMGRGVAFHVAATSVFGSKFPLEGWNWRSSMRGSNLDWWTDARRVANPKNRLFAFEVGTEYRVRVVREVDTLKLYVKGVLVAQHQEKSWGRIAGRSDADTNMDHGSGLIQLLTWTPMVVDDIQLTGTLSESWKRDQKAKLAAEKKSK